MSYPLSHTVVKKKEKKDAYCLGSRRSVYF